MDNCIFTPHCMECVCDKSCPILAETSYLLERNNIDINSPVYHVAQDDIGVAFNIIDTIESKYNKFGVVECKQTIAVSNFLTYCGICKYWKGNRLHCNVYNLKFSNYIESIKKSWSHSGTSDKLEYQQIWATTAKLLIISNIDFVSFKDFEVQTLLNLVHTRMDSGLTTIVVSPVLKSLIGSGQFYGRMQDIFGEAVMKWR